MENLVPIHIAAWLACAAFMVGLVNGALKLADRLKEKPTPSATYRSKEECEHRMVEHTREHTALDKRLDDGAVTMAALKTDAEAGRRRIFEHIDQVRMELLQGQEKLNERVANMPDRMITILKNAGAIE